MEGRVVFVTGGTRRIGAAIARSFAEQGAIVAAGYSRDRGARPTRCARQQRRLTIDKTVLRMSDEDWYRVLAVNLSGAFFMSQSVLPHMIERGNSRIINISSIIGEHGNIGQANYAASKSGLFGLTKTLAREACFQLQRAGKLSEDSIGLTVNAVAPGYVATEMLEKAPEQVLDKIKARIPVGRLGRPDEIARIVHFLASDHSSFITGAVWDANGGQDM